MTADEKRLITAVSLLLILGGAVRGTGIRSARRAAEGGTPETGETVPSAGDDAAGGARGSVPPSAGAGLGDDRLREAGDPQTAEPIDVNTGEAPSLERLPGIGPTKARAIIEWRAAHGPFRSLADLEKVPGIGPKTIERITPLVRFGQAGGRGREEQDEPRSRRSSLPGGRSEPGAVPAGSETEGVVGRPDG